MEFETRYGPLYLTRHAFERWVERTGRSELEMLGALSRAWRPSKRQLRRIRQREAGWSPRRILECDHAYFILEKRYIVTVYDKHQTEFKQELHHE
ncbi:hypothetical protein ACW5WQ_20335 [Aeromonas rivuli]|jgi:hypothetical protein|uniref:hypothetical protein n=1 Tax=Aeromonas rivuli TaxID=648794 RepID=UPI0005A88B74|nr:hypothetical protein [Aeromonas rivuli]